MLSPPSIPPASPGERQRGFCPHPHACGVSVGLARQDAFALCPVAEGLILRAGGHGWECGHSQGRGSPWSLAGPEPTPPRPGKGCWMLSRGTAAEQQLTVATSIPSCLRLSVSPCKPEQDHGPPSPYTPWRFMEKNKNKRQFPQKNPNPPGWLTLGLALWVLGRCLPIPAFLWGGAGSGPHEGEMKCPAQEAEPPNTKGLLQSLLGPRLQPAPRSPAE